MNTPPNPSDLKMAAAVCSAYGIAPSDIEDAAAEVWAETMRAPKEKRHAVAHRTARRILARQLGVTQRSLPGDGGRAQAIGEYEKARLECCGRDELHAFDLHGRCFAVENQVCPRCAAAGHFGQRRGACSCGFRYGPLGTASETDHDALERLRRDTRQPA